jgi:acetoacetate decarboxylase
MRLVRDWLCTGERAAVASATKGKNVTTLGKMTRSSFASVMPVHADPLNFTSASFRGVDQVTFSYRTNIDSAAALLPADLELLEDPKVSVMFLSYAFSSVGPFREYIHIIHARFRGEDVGFVPHIFISNERGMLAGREREGYPKLLGEIDFDMREANVYGLVTAKLSRPAGVTLAQGIFRPRELVGEIKPDEPRVVKAVGLRAIGSAVPGGPLAVCELVPSALEFHAGEIWSGDGTLMFTGASAFSPVHELPILGAVEATAFYNSSFRLRRPTETYPVTS